jgi:hypothetical protein
MPDRPDEFDRDLREGLEGLAGEASPPTRAPTSVLSSARRRVARNSAALAIAMVLVVGGVVAGYGLTGGNGNSPKPIGSITGLSPVPTSAPSTSVPPTSAPMTSPPSPVPAPAFGRWTGPSDTMLFVDGVVYRFARDQAAGQPAVVGIVPDETAVQPPVSTPYGVVVLGGRASHATRLWLLPAGGGPAQELAEGTDGIAVSADGSNVAFMQLYPKSSAYQPVVYSLADNSSSVCSCTFQGYARAVGYVGDRLVVNTGDGASAHAAVMSPFQRPTPLTGYGTAVATDPKSGLAVLTEGDGRCWTIVLITSSGSGGHGSGRQAGQRCGILQASFQPNGQAVSAVISNSPDRTAATTFVLQGTSSPLGGEATVDGAFQTLWKGTEAGAPTILVMTEPRPGTVAVVECRVSENLCSGDPVWTAIGAGDPGTAWLVEERPSS